MWIYYQMMKDEGGGGGGGGKMMDVGMERVEWGEGGRDDICFIHHTS